MRRSGFQSSIEFNVHVSYAGLIALVGYESNGCHLLYTWPNGEAKIAPQLDL